MRGDLAGVLSLLQALGVPRDPPLEDLLEPSVIERFVLFRDHGDTTLAEIISALKLKQRFVCLRGNGQLETADQIERYLAEVRNQVRWPQLRTADERYLATNSSQFHGA